MIIAALITLSLLGGYLLVGLGTALLVLEDNEEMALIAGIWWPFVLPLALTAWLVRRARHACSLPKAKVIK